MVYLPLIYTADSTCMLALISLNNLGVGER